MCKKIGVAYRKESVWELVITSNVPDQSFKVYYLVNLISTSLYMVDYMLWRRLIFDPSYPSFYKIKITHNYKIFLKEKIGGGRLLL